MRSPRHLRPTLCAALFALSGLSVATVAHAEMLSVKVSEANFRAGPSNQDQVLYIAQRYYPVKVLKRTEGWVQVRDYEGEQAWVASWLVAAAPAVIVKAPRANIRAQDTTRSDVVCRAQHGWAYRVVQRKGKWVQVGDEQGPIGWIHRKLLWGLED